MSEFNFGSLLRTHTHTYTYTVMLLTNSKAAFMSNINEDMIYIHPVVYNLSLWQTTNCNVNTSGFLSVTIQVAYFYSTE